MFRLWRISTTIWPGEFLELDVPNDFTEGEPIAVEPHILHPKSKSPIRNWPKPDILKSVDGKIRLINDTSSPQRVTRNGHICDIRYVFAPTELNTTALVFRPRLLLNLLLTPVE